MRERERKTWERARVGKSEKEEKEVGGNEGWRKGRREGGEGSEWEEGEKRGTAGGW